MNDIAIFLQWYLVLFLLGVLMLPLTTIIFSSLKDKGYIFSKVIAMLIVSYSIFLLGTLKILPFTTISVLLVVLAIGGVNVFLFRKFNKKKIERKTLFIWAGQEVIFLLALAVWSFIRGHEPSINGLEKFMDYGFINSILRSDYFPPLDMWFPPFSINYYYFGHLVTAVLTKLSALPSNYTYNLMVATVFALTVGLSFSIGFNIAQSLKATIRKSALTATLASLLVGVSGNLHTLYAFFSAYTPPEDPVPFWELAFRPFEIFSNGYWYPNATRFIPNTIHEFPLYSFVVSDLHGHVLNIPVVLTVIMFLFTVIQTKKITKLKMLFAGFLLAVMYMTNVLDFGIYTILTTITFGYVYIQMIKKPSTTLSHKVSDTVKSLVITIVSALIFTIPFSIFFKPFASGIGFLCSPDFLTAKESIGPFLFEVDHCQRSEWWMLLTLYGFFYLFVVVLAVFLWKNAKRRIQPSYIYSIILIIVATLLIVIPEFVYIKDIYPDHYRANTMFKLTYQAFIMLSLVSSVVITTVIKPRKNILLSAVTILFLAIVLLYPRFAVYSYYNNLEAYQGLDGTAYLKDRYPSDHEAIHWLNTTISGQPVILESQGDSYTDHARISANTGLPTVLGWTVHEWLWRGTYDIPAPRVDEVQTLYETSDLKTARELLTKHNVKYVYIGNLEREKYTNLSEEKFKALGNIVFTNENVTIYAIRN